MSPLELVLFGAACYVFSLVGGAVLISWLVDRGIARSLPDLPPLPRTTALVDPLRLPFHIVDDAVVWDAATTDLPTLAARVKTLLAELDAPGKIGRG